MIPNNSLRRAGWYPAETTICGYHLCHDLRSFRLDRITQTNVVNARFERPEHFDPLMHMMQAIASMPRKFAFELLLKTDICTAKNEVFDVLGILEASEDGVIMRGSMKISISWRANRPFFIRFHCART